MINIDTLITYLTANCPTFTSITHALTTDAIDELSSDAPALYVYSGEEEAGENRIDNGTAQEVTENINFIIVGAVASMYALRTELNDAMLGYQYNAAHEEFRYVGGNNLDIRAGYVWREVVYQTTYDVRNC